jgi:hypothetical protein
MASYPKLLPQVTIDSTCDVFAYSLSGARTADIPDATYDTILEVCAALEVKLKVVSADFSVTVSSRGFVVISNSSTSWTVTWGSTDVALRDLLGFVGTETVTGAGPYVLTATKRHLRGWYSPVPVEYPGRRRRIARRYQETDDGDVSIIASATTHQYLDLLFDACLEPQLEPGQATTADDGYGSSIDWTSRTFGDFWAYVAALKFRYYEDAENGTVAAPGTEGTHYLECVRTDATDELEFEQVDPNGYTYFSVRLPVKVV